MSTTRHSETLNTEELENEKIRITLHLAKEYLNHEPSLEVPSDPIAIPSSTRRSGLSAIVNHLLNRKIPQEDSTQKEEEENDDKLPSIPFDFLLNQKLLRTSIEAAARRECLGLEQAIEILYFPALPPPLQQETSIKPEPDWIYSLSYCPLRLMSSSPNVNRDSQIQGYLVSGSAEGSIRVMETQKIDSMAPLKVQKSLQPHSGPISCISTIPVIMPHMNSENVLIASGSMDQTLSTHLYTPFTSKIQSLATCTGGHFASISSVACAASSTDTTTTSLTHAWLASGDYDGGLCIWNVPFSFTEDSDGMIQSRKKMKRHDKQEKSLNSTLKIQQQTISPSISFKAHTHNLSGIVWSHDSTDSSRTLITSSWDHSIKSWDMEKQNNITTLNGSKVVTCLGRCTNSDVVATGHPDCTVRLWDMRSSVQSNTTRRVAGHVSDSTLLPR